MPTFTLYDGRAKPRVARGHRQFRLARFAYDAQCWHAAPKNASDRRALKALERKGFIETFFDGVDLLYRYIPARAA
jgi:hypothetical protein